MTMEKRALVGADAYLRSGLGDCWRLVNVCATHRRRTATGLMRFARSSLMAVEEDRCGDERQGQGHAYAVALEHDRQCSSEAVRESRGEVRLACQLCGKTEMDGG